MFNLVICNAFFSIPLFKYAGLELLNIFLANYKVKTYSLKNTVLEDFG